MTEFTFELSTKIYFGTHIVEAALEKEKKWLTGKVMIVTTGRSLTECGYLEKLRRAVGNIAGQKNVLIYDGVSRNPRLDEVKKAALIGKQQGVKTVIGFGGGSALDAAKATAVGIASNKDLETYLLEGKEPPEETLPIIAIPTTAGTGSELSKGAIISSPKHNIKAGIRGQYMLPKAAIVDASYTWTVPRQITMEIGFDVLAHAVESYVAVKANIFAETLSEKAIVLVGENLPLLNVDLENHDAREKMCYASMIMGLNLANVGTCLPHRMQYAIGAATDTSHAAGLAALYPSWIMHEYEVNDKKIDHILELLAIPCENTAKQARESFSRFLESIGLSYRLSNLGINSEQLSQLEKQVIGNISNDRLAETDGIIGTIFRESL